MAVPRNRTSNARKNSRRSHHAKKPLNLKACTNCKNACLQHKMCPHCGFYAGKQVISSKKDVE